MYFLLLKTEMSSGGPELPHEPFKIEKYTQDEVPQLEVAIFRLGQQIYQRLSSGGPAAQEIFNP